MVSIGLLHMRMAMLMPCRSLCKLIILMDTQGHLGRVSCEPHRTFSLLYCDISDLAMPRQGALLH
jgi:hypothetical protein